MKLKFFIFVAFVVLFSACAKKENKNLVVETSHRDPRVDNFFGAVGIPLLPMSGNDSEELTADLSRISTLFTNAMPAKTKLTESGDEESIPPFDLLAKNAGLVIASQIWKTQLTSVD